MLFGAGWTLDEVLNLSWEQLSTVVGCVLQYKAEQANIVMEMVSASLGGKVGKRSKRSKPNRKPANQPTGRAKDETMLRQFAELGIPVVDG